MGRQRGNLRVYFFYLGLRRRALQLTNRVGNLLLELVTLIVQRRKRILVAIHSLRRRRRHRDCILIEYRSVGRRAGQEILIVAVTGKQSLELTCKLTRISEPLDLTINPSSLTVDALALTHNLPDRADPWQIIYICVLNKLQHLLLQLLRTL